MSLQFSLLDSPSAENVPEEYDGRLECAALAVCSAFNKYGTLFAAGCNDGRIGIWDFPSRMLAKSIIGHAAHPVTSLSWSRSGHRLVSSSLDNTIAIWNVLSGECELRWIFNSPILKAQFNPRNDKMILLCTVKQPALLLGINYETNSVEHLLVPTEDGDSESNMVASFDRRGRNIFTGNMKGRLTVVKCPPRIERNTRLEMISSFKMQTGAIPAAIKEIEFGARNKDYFLVNASDKTIRMYSCEAAIQAGINGSCDEIRRFQDMINKTVWKRCCFSGDPGASYVCGGVARNHQIYFWRTDDGTIKKILRGEANETILDLQFHPLKPMVVSVASGIISVWTKPEIENWSAYAPEFKELEENEEYVERESEFDLEDDDKRLHELEKGKDDSGDEKDIDLDIETVKREEELISSDEEGDEVKHLDFIPVTYEEDMIENTQAH